VKQFANSAGASINFGAKQFGNSLGIAVKTEESNGEYSVMLPEDLLRNEMSDVSKHQVDLAISPEIVPAAMFRKGFSIGRFEVT
jgi:hypothetical protein